MNKEEYWKRRKAGQRGQEQALSVTRIFTKWERRDGTEVSVEPSLGKNRAMSRQKQNDPQYTKKNSGHKKDKGR